MSARTPTSPPVIESTDEWCPGSLRPPADVWQGEAECAYCGRYISLYGRVLARHRMPPFDTHEADDYGQ